MRTRAAWPSPLIIVASIAGLASAFAHDTAASIYPTPQSVIDPVEQQKFHQRFLRMQPVFGFVPDDALRAVDHVR